ncbi:DUF1003 domain-containing protein [Enterococcus rivorum]|uniref:Cyclic nucleotide-binding protein n=1 Tax=Enterococcus rivorum TaxID=762845 RepID=A0A1E5KZY3_9ENTE|nr:DUF1003 domain-containing protein [Enterococcus rivorum]MBP2099344.1 putative membrane protein [Enterococcus rivorum]OEH83209.1 cyclic nucleotide-binding protein [Enterococcus rivorum]
MAKGLKYRKRKIKNIEPDEIQIKDAEEEISKFILSQHPELTEDSKITFQELLDYRLKYIEIMISKDSDKMEILNRSIVDDIKKKETVSNDLNETMEKNLTFGQKSADAIAKFGGSWPFIFIFILVLVTWITINSIGILTKPFDKYPYILLNLVLSCLAAVQAPIIMMSQNRQAARDRLEADNDYEVNLKAEIEVALLHEKIDYLITSQWQHMVQMQQMQIELLGKLQKQVNDLNNDQKNK